MSTDNTRRYALVTKPDIRHHGRRQFLETVRWCALRSAPHLHRHGRFVFFYTIPADLNLSSAEADELCQAIANYYGLPWQEIDQAWLRTGVRTVEDVRRRLWHAANQYHHDRRDYPLH